MSQSVACTDCPDAARLQQLLNHVLVSADEEEVVRHLDSCSSCQHHLEELANQGSSIRIRPVGESPPVSSAYWNALERLENQEVGVTTPLPDSPVQMPLMPEEEVSLAFLDPTDDPDYLGQLGHFQIASVLGRGGMGMVLRAFDPCLQRFVAIKLLDPELAKDETSRKRFCREARAAAAVTHENVVAVHQVEHEEEKDIPFLVMQLVTGTSLEDRLRRVGALPLRDILRIGMQTAAGLAAAHAQGLIHRDIKPGNILLETGTDRVKVTDFGLAKAVEDVKLTGTGFIAGTPLYMAPEQARGEPVDHRADLFSLGSVLYEMCTGRPPFEGNTPFVVLQRVTQDVPLPIRDVNPEVPDELVAVIDKLHAKKPEDRFESAAGVAEHLSELLARLPAPSLPSLTLSTSSDHLQRRTRWRDRPALIFLAGLLLGIGLGVAPWLVRGGEAGPVPPGNGGEPASREPRAILSGNSGPVWSLAFAPDSSTVAMAIDDGTVKMWDARAARVRSTVNAHPGPVWSVALSRQGGLMATASDEGSVKIWNAATGKDQGTLPHKYAVRAVAFSPDGNRLVTGSRDGGVAIWDLNDTEKPLHTLGHKGTVMAVAFSPDGKTVASAGGDKTVKLWDAESGQEQLTLQGHTGGVYAVAFSPDSKTLASGGWDHTVRLWDAASGNLLATMKGHAQDVWAVAFAPDGRTLASASEDHTVRLWDVTTQHELATWKGHEGTLYSVAYSPDGKTVASGSRDGTVRLWDVPAGR